MSNPQPPSPFGQPSPSSVARRAAGDGAPAAGPDPPPEPVTPSTDDTPTTISRPRPPEAVVPEAWQGRRLGHFELLDAIGAGGMAAVLGARDLQLGREVA